MQFLSDGWALWSLLVTIWQAIYNLCQFRRHIFTAEAIHPEEAKPKHSSEEQPTNCPTEYAKATVNLSKTLIFTRAAVEAFTKSCRTPPLIPSLACRLYPITTIVATTELAIQTGKCLSTYISPPPLIKIRAGN